MTMVDECTTPGGDPDTDPVLDAMAQVRHQLDCVTAGLDVLEAQDAKPPPD